LEPLGVFVQPIECVDKDHPQLKSMRSSTKKLTLKKFCSRKILMLYK